MEYRINIDLKAQEEIEQAIQYYLVFRKRRPVYFIADLESAFAQLRKNPFKALRYKNERAIRLQEFPFALYFTVHENEQLVTIHSCFQDLRNPRRKEIDGQWKMDSVETTADAWHFSTVSPFSVPKIRERKIRRGLRRQYKTENRLVF